MKYKKLPEKWIKYLQNEPESGMGYQIATVRLKDNTKFENVVIVQSELIGEIKGYNEIPFEPDDIISIELNPHQKYWGEKK